MIKVENAYRIAPLPLPVGSYRVGSLLKSADGMYTVLRVTNDLSYVFELQEVRKNTTFLQNYVLVSQATLSITEC